VTPKITRSSAIAERSHDAIEILSTAAAQYKKITFEKVCNK